MDGGQSHLLSVHVHNPHPFFHHPHQRPVYLLVFIPYFAVQAPIGAYLGFLKVWGWAFTRTLNKEGKKWDFPKVGGGRWYRYEWLDVEMRYSTSSSCTQAVWLDSLGELMQFLPSFHGTERHGSKTSAAIFSSVHSPSLYVYPTCTLKGFLWNKPISSQYYSILWVSWGFEKILSASSWFEFGAILANVLGHSHPQKLACPLPTKVRVAESIIIRLLVTWPNKKGFKEGQLLRFSFLSWTFK